MLNPTTNARSYPGRMMCCRNPVAASFSNPKRPSHRAAHVHEQAEFDGQVGFAAEIEDRLDRLVIVKNREIALVQIADEFAMAIGGDEKHIDFIDALPDGQDRLSVRLRRWLRQPSWKSRPEQLEAATT